MNNFKSFLETDLDVFFNNDEFATEHTFNGESILVVVDEDLLDKLKQRIEDNYDGLFYDEITVFLKAKDLKMRPIVNEIVSFDKKEFLVKSCRSSSGVLEVVLGITTE